MRRPNIVLILADDMGYGDFGVFNEGLSCTPTLDRLVGEGICLRQHYSASPVCAPARASLMTGRYPHRTGAIDTLEGRGLDRLALREVTMADAFKSAGYRTGLVGKWHLGALDPRYHPNARGFDEFAGFRGGWQDYYRWRLDCNGTFRNADGRYLTDVFTEEAVGFVRRHAQEPFFLHVTYNAPHWPYQAPEEDMRPYLDSGKFTKGQCFVYAMIERMDRGIERILDELKRQGLEEDTIVLFTSDNGPELGEGWGLNTDRFNCGFNGAKGFVYEGGIRVPMVVRWPAGLDSGRYMDDMVHFVDWLPTLVAAAGIRRPNGPPLDGKNVLPVLRGEGGEAETRRAWQWNRYTPLVTSNAALRDGAWKLVRPRIAETLTISRQDGEMDRALKYEPGKHTKVLLAPEPERTVPPPPPPELYHIERDPLERNNLASSEPERTSRLLRELEEWFASVEADRRSINDVW